MGTTLAPPSDPVLGSRPAPPTGRSWLRSSGRPALATAAASASLAGGLGFANGGYFASTWGWTTLALLWAASLGLLLHRPALGRGELVFLGSLAGLTGWTALSSLWAASAWRPLLETQRLLLYLALATAVLVLGRPRRARDLLVGLLAGIVLVAGYGLATRLFPERLGSYDPVATYRLAEPLGYWNALGVLAALGALLALGLALRSPTLRGRALAGACLPLLLATLYFTFGRGPWIALAFGLAALLTVDPRRLQAAAGLLALAPASVAAVLVASRAEALTRQGAPLADASSSGYRLALALLLLVLLSAALTAAFGYAERRAKPKQAVKHGFAGVLAAALAVAVAAAWVRFGSPPVALTDAYDAFTAPPPQAQPDLNRRLFNLSGNGRPQLWHLAWEEVERSPVIGTGAGAYELAWLERRPVGLKARDAHSLYLETLAELGAVGLAALLLALALPVAAALRARRQPHVPAALGAYSAYLLHAGADWDWEMTGVTAVALVCGATLLLAGRGEARPTSSPMRALLLALCLALVPVTLVGLLSAGALAASHRAAARADWAGAEAEARRAARFAPWSPEPLRALGEAQLAKGDIEAARGSFQRALELAPREWSLWFDLARTLEGPPRRQALVQASVLNPRSPEIAQFLAEERDVDAGIDATVATSLEEER